MPGHKPGPLDPWPKLRFDAYHLTVKPLVFQDINYKHSWSHVSSHSLGDPVKGLGRGFPGESWSLSSKYQSIPLWEPGMWADAWLGPWTLGPGTVCLTQSPPHAGVESGRHGQHLSEGPSQWQDPDCLLLIPTANAENSKFSLCVMWR